MSDLFRRNLERLARARIGERVTLYYPLSPYHGQDGRIVDIMEMYDRTLVFTVEWPDGVQKSYPPDRLTTLDDAPCWRHERSSRGNVATAGKAATITRTATRPDLARRCTRCITATSSATSSACCPC